MEHVTITPIGDKVKITPEQGYRIADYNGNTYGIVVCAESDIKNFKVVSVETTD